uniref:Myosin regulatory light chain interacting protein n=1 Tax=Homo sapiens TaxID=9606 RepID=Q5TIA5_HUMAN
MLCYVTRPDAVLMEVEVEAKANGEDCLNQAYLFLAHQGGPLGRPPLVFPRAGSGTQCPPGPDQVWRLQPEHCQV